MESMELQMVLTCSRAVANHSCHDSIHYPFVQTNTTKIYNLECHLNDLLNKVTLNKISMNIKTMNKEHKNTS